jgi:arylsulfatase A-like enzyme
MSGVAPYPLEYHLDAGIAGQTIELVRRYAAEGLGTPDRPFALVCSFHGPHFPIEVPEPYAALYRPEDVARPPSFDDTFEGKPPGQRTHPWLQLAAHLSWPEWQRVIAHYWGFATFVDALMGRVLDALEELGLAARTVVVATSDHGEMAGHHRMFDKGPYFYEDVMRVPFVWRYPGVVRPRGVDDRLVSHVELVPTLLELAGVRPSVGAPPLQGRSLAADLAGAPAPAGRDAAFGETNVGDRVNPQVDARMVVKRDHKYVYRPGGVSASPAEAVDELYDLARDPDELHNVAGAAAYRPVQEDLVARLRDWMRQTEDRLTWRC